MMDRTDRHFRWLMRHITQRALLYTPMISARALLAPGAWRQLVGPQPESRLALQLGGSDPALLAAAARVGESEGADEINLNCGCPSPAALSATWGAALMGQPQLVAEAVGAMKAAVSVPVTVKHRLGAVPNLRGGARPWAGDFEALLRFVDTVGAAGCDRFIVHARVAVLGGLSAVANRVVPPLEPDLVGALVRERPQYCFELNGGVTALGHVTAHLRRYPGLTGVMVGRAAYDDPWAFADADMALRAAPPPVSSRRALGEAWLSYVAQQIGAGADPHGVTRHGLGLWHGVAGGRRARAQVASIRGAHDGVAVLRAAIQRLPDGDDRDERTGFLAAEETAVT